MIIINLRCEICDMRFVICDLEGYDPFVITCCRTRTLNVGAFIAWECRSGYCFEFAPESLPKSEKQFTICTNK